MKRFAAARFLTRLWLAGLVSWFLITPSAAQAHPLDEFYQVTYISLAPNRITMQIELYPGILIAPKILALIDLDQDDRISEAEAQAYVNLFLKDVAFEIDHIPTPLKAANLEFSNPLDLRAGVGAIRFELYADLAADHRGSHQLFYKNNHQPEISVYLVNALSDAERWVEIRQQERDVLQSSLQLNYTIKPEAPVDFGPAEALADIQVPGGISEGQERLTRYLYTPELSPLFLLIALGLASILGGLHALTPGHGKTLVAAYLIGSRGTVGHAVVLGGIVTFTHTASVIAIGLLALLASQFIVPNVLVPSLEILSGFLVIYLGLQLLRARWKSFKTNQPVADHLHEHVSGPEHDEAHGHSHSHSPGHHHHHLPEQVKLSDLLTLGISGGLVPCPEALGIMLIAIGLNRILLGLGLIVAFSFGLAAVLIVIGILLVRSKSFLDRAGGIGGRWQAWLPLASAIIVTLLGLGIMAKGLMAYLA